MILLRTLSLYVNEPMVGPFAASPDGQGFSASFESFNTEHLPDAKRLAWLRSQRN